MNDAIQPTSARIGRIVATVSTGFVVTQLDVTIVNIALAEMGSKLGASVSGLQWIVDAYTLAFAVLMLSAGALGDRLGARRMYTVGMVVFALASAGCGLAPDAPWLVAARALQGVGAAAMLPNSLALLNRACRHDPGLRARAVGWWTAAGAVSIAAGPVVGGLLIAAFGWRSIFLVNLPLCALGLWATLAWIPADRAGASSADGASSRPRSVDLPGQVLAVLALTAFTAAVIEGRPRGMTDPWVLAGVGVALLAGVAFVLVESRVREPMMPLSLFGKRSFSAAVGVGICVNLTYYGVVFELGLYLQRVRGDTALQAGLSFLPLTGGFLLSNVASGWIVERFGVRVPMVAGGLVAALGYGLLHGVDASTSLWWMLLPFLLIPTGMGVAVPAMTTAVLASVAHARAATASAVLNTARQAAGAVGVAVFGALAAGAGQTSIVGGLHTAAAICVGVLLLAALLGALVHPKAHAATAD